MGNKYYKLFMVFGNTGPVKCSNNIKLYIEFSAVQGIKCLINERKWVLVFNGNVIKSFIVIADPHPFSQLSGEQKWGCGRGY